MSQRDREGRVECPAGKQTTEAPPLTPGRDLGVEQLWSTWFEARLALASDRRGRLDTRSDVGTLTIGLDRRFGANVVAGFLTSLELGTATGIDKTFRANSTGFAIGPYFAILLTPHWAVDASLTYGQSTIDQQLASPQQLASFSGTYTSRVYSGSLNVHGQYAIDQVALRPKLSLNYAHVRNDAYAVDGVILGLPLSLRAPRSSYSFGTVELSGEVSRIFTTAGGTTMMPYAELGVHYDFERPYGGRTMGGLSQEIPSAWGGSIRAGVRATFSSSVLFEASGGYLTLGQSKLDVWEARFRVSLAL